MEKKGKERSNPQVEREKQSMDSRVRRQTANGRRRWRATAGRAGIGKLIQFMNTTVQANSLTEKVGKVVS